ncbi:ribokinase [Mariannaea sp. PMI_226]|nr:ribokinase [Mariannaea sp. PMI_226]
MAEPKALPRLTILGSLNMDLVSYVNHHPLPGETMTATKFVTSPGGKGANQAVACAKLSRASDLSSATAVVAMAGAVGGDGQGMVLRDSMSSYGVDIEGVVVRKGMNTGIAVIVVDEPTGQNRIILSPEANYDLHAEDFRSIPGPRPDLLIMQLEIPLVVVLQALKTAKASGIPVLLNPAPAQELPADVYEGLDHLVVNETEASILSGLPESELETREGLDRVGGRFIERGVKNVIITLGGRGVYYCTKANKSDLVSAISTSVVDTTAAGDTFVGSYALSIVDKEREFDIDEAIARANRASAITVSREGAQVSIPWKNELKG